MDESTGGGPEYIKKKVRIGSIELAEDEWAIVVCYEVRSEQTPACSSQCSCQLQCKR